MVLQNLTLPIAEIYIERKNLSGHSTDHTRLNQIWTFSTTIMLYLPYHTLQAMETKLEHRTSYIYRLVRHYVYLDHLLLLDSSDRYKGNREPPGVLANIVAISTLSSVAEIDSVGELGVKPAATKGRNVT